MKEKVYVLHYMPLKAGSQDAFIEMALSGFSENRLWRKTDLSGVTVKTCRESGNILVSGMWRTVLAGLEHGLQEFPNKVARIKEAIRQAKGREPAMPLKVGKWKLPWHRRTLLMGILNMTPDSFSDGGMYNELDQAMARARQLVEDGADILDVGGESTRPAGSVYGTGAKWISAEEEKSRVLPLIERLSAELDIPISIDTYKAEVAEAAIQAGAHIVNDVWGLKRDPDMAATVAKYDVPAILMHNRECAHYDRAVILEMIDDFRECVAIARAAGVREEQIILDPGIGFGKIYEHNLQVMHNLEQISYLGYPLLLGTSRKSIVGQTLDLPIEARVEGTGATVAFGITKGCHIMRVHDVKEMARVCRMTDAMVRPFREEESVHG